MKRAHTFVLGPAMAMVVLITVAVCPAYAGTITLIADKDWCCVQVKSGNQRGDANPVVYQGAVRAGQQVYSGIDGAYVCYRRENRQGDPRSGTESMIRCDSNTLNSNTSFTISYCYSMY